MDGERGGEAVLLASEAIAPNSAITLLGRGGDWCWVWQEGKWVPLGSWSAEILVMLKLGGSADRPRLKVGGR